MFPKHETGLGLIDFVIGAAVVGGLGLGAAQMMKGSGVTNKKVNLRVEIQDFSKHIGKLVNSEQACTLTLGGKSATNGTVSTIYGVNKDGSQFVGVDSSTVYGPMALKVESMRLFDAPGTEDGVQVIPGEKGTTNLEVKYLMREGSPYAGRDIRSKIKIGIQTDASGQILSCYSIEGGGTSLWKRVASTPNDIYYTGGNVGIGTNDPQELFSVFGPIVMRTDSGGTITLGGGSGYRLAVDTVAPLELFVAPTARSADLVPRSIILDGLLHLSSSSASCTGSNRGAVRYSGGQVQVCEASGWVNKRRGPIMQGYQGSIPGSHTGCSIRTTRMVMDDSMGSNDC
jgi:hypothetical protein